MTGLLHPHLADRLDDVAGQGADIGAAVAADLALVVHAAQGDAGELAAHGAGDALAEAGLADARRADEAQDRAPALGRQLVDGQKLDDPLLDLLQAVMVLVEHALRLGDVDPVLGRLAPGQLDQRVEIGRGSCRARPRPRACAPAGAAPCWPAARPPRASWPRRSPSSGPRPRPPCPRPRPAPCGSSPAARAAGPRAGASPGCRAWPRPARATGAARPGAG